MTPKIWTTKSTTYFPPIFGSSMTCRGANDARRRQTVTNSEEQLDVYQSRT